MNKFGVSLLLMCFSVNQVLSSSIPLDQSEWPLLDIDEEVIDIPFEITAETPTACKGKFSRVGDHCYYFSLIEATWHEASKACHSLSAALAHPKNSQENSKLTRYLRVHKDTAIAWWIGATDRDHEGQWVWAHDNTPVAYTNWLYGEPNDGWENEDCAHYRRDAYYKWNDATCENKYQYICQYVDPNDEFSSGDGRLEETIPSTTTTTADPLTVSKSDFVQLGEHSYYFSTTTATFDQASKACQSIDTQLAHPKNSVENSKITGHIREYETMAKAWWIGATDRDDEGRWVWSHDNTSVGYADWLSGEPNDAYDNEHCAHLRRDVNYDWNDAPCNHKYNFICQSENLNDDNQELSSTEENLEVLDTNYCKRTASVATVNSTKSDFTKVGTKCYHFSHTKASFNDASKACQSLGAEFAHPMNYQENLQLTNYLRNKYQDDYKGWWIGATDEDEEGQWYWAHDKSPVGYTDWSSGEPSDAYENEHCAHYRRNSDYKWNDVPCGNKYYYICQYGHLNDSSLELPSDEVDTSDEEKSSEVVTSSGAVATSGEVEAEIDENTEQMLVSAATWNPNGCYSAIVITCAVIGANLFVTQLHTAS